MSEQLPNYEKTRINDEDKARHMADYMDGIMEAALESKEAKLDAEKNIPMLQGALDEWTHQAAGRVLNELYPEKDYAPTIGNAQHLLSEHKRIVKSRKKREVTYRRQADEIAQEAGDRYDAKLAEKERRHLAAQKIMATYATLQREDESQTRIQDEDKAHVMAHAADWWAGISADHRAQNEDDSWTQKTADRQAEEVGKVYDQKQAERARDYSQLSRAEEPKTRIENEDKAQEIANKIKQNMDIAAGYYPYGSYESQEEFKNSKLAETEADKLGKLADANRDVIYAGYYYDLAHSQLEARVDDTLKAYIMADRADHHISAALEIEKSGDNPQAAAAQRQEAKRWANIMGSEYDQYGPQIAGQVTVMNIDEETGTVQRIDPGVLISKNDTKRND